MTSEPFKVVLHDLTTVSRKPVQNRQNIALDMAKQALQELDNFLGRDGFFEDLKEIPNGQPGDNP